jgi:glycosyltransferase involved in cell wall biosynthesis
VIRLYDLDLAREGPALSFDPGDHYAAVLASWKGIPLVEMRLYRAAGGATLTPAQLRQRAFAEAGWHIWERWSQAGLAEPPDDELPPISVVICTRDRAQLLARCLRSLQRLDYPRFEVVVVDNGSKDPEVRRVIDASGFRYAVEPRPGLDWARNRGVAESRHGIISYIDDDALAAPGWLRGVARGFRDPDAMMVTGLIMPAELETEAQRLFEWYGGMSKGLGRRKFPGAEMSDAAKLAAHQYGVGANLSFRRETFERVGLFDTALDVGTPSFGAGDVDMIHRVLAAGMTIVYEPSAMMRHRHRRDVPGLRRQIYSNGRAYGVYLLKALRDRTVPRAATVRYAAQWFGGWVCARVVRNVLGLEHFPLRLLWAEFRGALDAPWAYVATMRHDRRMRTTKA